MERLGAQNWFTSNVEDGLNVVRRRQGQRRAVNDQVDVDDHDGEDRSILAEDL
jgi:hypothetical protein